MDMDPSEVKHLVIEVVTGIYATRYISAAGLVMLLWDHILTFDDEVRLIWKAKRSLIKYLFIFLRYTVLGQMLWTQHTLSGISQTGFSLHVCKAFYVTMLYVGIIGVGIGNLIVLMRVWQVWRFDRLIVRITGAIFIIAQVATLVTASLGAVTLVENLYFITPQNFCVLASKSRLAGIWAPGVFFEVSIFVVIMTNALTRPRLASDKISLSLIRDGLLYFITLTSLRIVNLVTSIASPIYFIFLCVFFIYAATTTIVTRLTLNILKEEEKLRAVSLYGPNVTLYQFELLNFKGMFSA